MDTIKPEFEIEVKEDGGVFHCYIPATDGYYFAKTREDIQKIGSAMVKAMVAYWNQENGGTHIEAKKFFDSIGTDDCISGIIDL